MVTDSFTLRYIECPGGYTLVKSTSTEMMSCKCEDSREILHCEDDQDSILIEVFVVRDQCKLKHDIGSQYMLESNRRCQHSVASPVTTWLDNITLLGTTSHCI